MPIYIYDADKTETGSALISLTGAIPLRRYDGYNFWRGGKRVEFDKTDLVVCWGKHVPAIPDVHMLNTNLYYRDQLTINTMYISPQGRGFLPGYTGLLLAKYRDYGGNWEDSIHRLKTGQLTDLVASKEFPGYGTRASAFENQYKIHVFQGKAIKTGSRVDLRTGKSKTLPGDGVWYKYDYTATPPLEAIQAAQKATAHLGFDFLVCTVGTYRGMFMFRKFLTAPVLDATDAAMYAKYITGWFNAISGAREELVVAQREW